MRKRLTARDIDDAKIGARVCASITNNDDAASCFRHLARGNERRALNAHGPAKNVQALLNLAQAAKDAADRRRR